MTPPTIIAVSPTDGTLDVVLGSQVIVTFDQVIDTSTISAASFSITGPGESLILTPDQMIAKNPTTLTGVSYIPGTFMFVTNMSSQTVVTFTPSVPFQENLVYTVLVLGGDGSIATNGVKNIGGQFMPKSFTWSFTTGDLNLTTPPITSPIPPLFANIDPNTVKMVPSTIPGDDLTQMLNIVFPNNLDPTSFDLNDILVSIEPIVGDPNVMIPAGLVATVSLANNKIEVVISGW